MRHVRTLVRSAALVILGSQVLLQQGLAPSASAATERGLSTTGPRGVSSAGRSPGSRALAAKRADRWRSFPHRVGEASDRPFITGRKAPLLAMKGGRLERTGALAGPPETLRVVGLKVQFATDRLGSQTTTPDGKFDLRDGKALGIVIDPPPHDRKFFLSHLEALSRYWKFASYGHLVIEYDLYPKADSAAYLLGDTGDYGPWTLGQESFDSAQRFFKDAVQAADQADSIPFGQFDVVALFHAGSDFQTDLNGDSPRDFPTFQINLGEDSFQVNTGLWVHGGLVMPETESQDGYYA
ncbi:MAG TPA: hypothetical protein VK527_02130, partial [Candidatus Limnocylindrales bacterium]|nr:hypothetical protein [Candidatus Limnocylindrales bacterium]